MILLYRYLENFKPKRLENHLHPGTFIIARVDTCGLGNQTNVLRYDYIINKYLLNVNFGHCCEDKATLLTVGPVTLMAAGTAGRQGF